MKRSIIHSIVICLAALGLSVVVACSSQNEPLPDVDGHLLAVFTLDMGEAAPYAAAQGTPEDGKYDQGSGLENVVDFYKKNYRCYLFDKDCKFVSKLPAVMFTQSDDKKTYTVRLRLDNTEDVKNALTNGCRFVFLANWGNYTEPTPGITTIADLCKAEFAFSQEMSVLSDNNLIPMYGVKEFESGVPDFIAGKVISDIGTIHLLRAYAKVEVNLNFVDFAEDPVVKSVSLTHCNNKGFKAPKDVIKEGDYVTGSWLTDYTPVNIPSDANDFALELTKDESTGHYIAYVPEFRNVDASSNTPLDSRSQIKVSFTIGDVNAGGLAVEKEFDFKYSADAPENVAGKHVDILRNNWYKFNITARGKDIEWEVDVIPFSYVEVTPDYGLQREEFTGYIIGKDSQNRDCWYDGNYYDPATAVPLYLGPTGHEGEFVTIKGKEYGTEYCKEFLLVYADYERTVAKLDHFFEKETRKRYWLYAAGRTGYENVDWKYYLNDLKRPVWLDEDYNEWEVGKKWIKDPDDPTQEKVIEVTAWRWKTGTVWYRTLNEWDRVNYNQAVWDFDPYVYPKYWFDILGNRYPYSEGDTKEKRAAILGDWVKYLE